MKNKRQNNREEQIGAPVSIARHKRKTMIVTVVMVLLILTTCLTFVCSLKQQLYKQRSYSLSQTMEKIVQVVNTVIDNEWDRLIYVSYELSREPEATKEQLLKRLADFYQVDPKLHSWKLSCIDSTGNLYSWDGQIERWSLPDMLLVENSEFQITIMEARDSDDEQMTFLYRLPEPIQLTGEDVTLTHTVLSLDMATFGEALEISAFGDSSFSYITEQNGTRIYHQQNQNEFIAAYNILTAMQNTSFLYDGSYADLEDASSAGVPYTAEIQREGKRYFVSYAPLSVSDWSLYIFIPEANVGGSATSFVRMLLVQVTVIALLLILMIAAFIWTNSRQTLARQQMAVNEANRATKAKSDFLSHMSHDIRTPLNGIMGMCHIAKQQIGDEAAVFDCLDKIDLSSHQLMALINDVLDMSRIEQDKVEIDSVPVDLEHIIRTCAVHIEVSTQEKGIVFERNTTGVRHSIVSADPVLLEKILTNILGNASKFTPAGGRIELRVSETEADNGQGMYRFEIKDSGVGMQPEFMVHLFEPFSQERTGSRTKYQGTGLGLSIVKNLVDRLGGTISVESTIGEGSTFTVNLPLYHLEQTDLSKEQEDTSPFDGSGLRVLLVEDNQLNLIIARNILEGCGMIVDTAEDGALAVEQFQSAALGKYDLIFMDLRMPVMDGLEASRRIRALHRSDADVPIIALTADAFSEDVEKTRSAGMNDHLGKPIELNKLYAVLRKHFPDGKKA